MGGSTECIITTRVILQLLNTWGGPMENYGYLLGLHDRDPTLILWKACYNNMAGGLMRKTKIARLHIFPEDEVPQDILQNITAQIPQVRPVPKKLTEYTDAEKEAFPKLFEPADDFV